MAFNDFSVTRCLAVKDCAWRWSVLGAKGGALYFGNREHFASREIGFLEGKPDLLLGDLRLLHRFLSLPNKYYGSIALQLSVTTIYRGDVAISELSLMPGQSSHTLPVLHRAVLRLFTP